MGSISTLIYTLELILCSTILVHLWFIISLAFFYLSKLLFSGFLQFKSNFVRDQNTMTKKLNTFSVYNLGDIIVIALFTFNFPHLHYNVIQRGCEALLG